VHLRYTKLARFTFTNVRKNVSNLNFPVSSLLCLPVSIFVFGDTVGRIALASIIGNGSHERERSSGWQRAVYCPEEQVAKENNFGIHFAGERKETPSGVSCFAGNSLLSTKYRATHKEVAICKIGEGSSNVFLQERIQVASTGYACVAGSC
jgi:hypothetical protein